MPSLQAIFGRIQQNLSIGLGMREIKVVPWVLIVSLRLLSMEFRVQTYKILFLRQLY